MENFKQFKDAAKEAKEIRELVEKYLKLQAQIIKPTRDGMIEALSGAQTVAGQEISALERSQGEVYLTPWENIPDNYLYCKLVQYQRGLYNHAVKKLGEEAFKRLLKEYATINQ